MRGNNMSDKNKLIALTIICFTIIYVVTIVTGYQG